ncbi:hypothetical protein AVEN_230071-1, partial [Araneus ventricosus]
MLSSGYCTMHPSDKAGRDSVVNCNVSARHSPILVSMDPGECFCKSAVNNGYTSGLAKSSKYVTEA